MKRTLKIATERNRRTCNALLALALALGVILCPSPLSACSGRAAKVELTAGGSRAFEDVCVLGHGDAPAPTAVQTMPLRPAVPMPVAKFIPAIQFSLADGTQIELPFDSIKEIRLVDVKSLPGGGALTRIMVNFHVSLKRSVKELDGQTSVGMTMSMKYDTDPRTKQDNEDPVVFKGKDPELDGAILKLRFSQVKSIVFTGPGE